MKIYSCYPGGITKITNGKDFYQTEDLSNVITVYVDKTNLTGITYSLTLEFLRADNRKTTLIPQAFEVGDDTTLIEDGVTYDIHNFVLTDSQLAVAGTLAFTCYITIFNNSNVVVSRGTLFNAVSNVRKTVTYSANTIFVVEKNKDVPIIVADMKTAIETLAGQLASKVNKADVADNLTTNDSDKVLSAKQGYVLKGLIDNDNTAIGLLNEGLATKANSADVYTKNEDDALLEQKQDVLTFDSTPTANSTNPVTSGGVKTALDAKADKSDTYTRKVTDAFIAYLETNKANKNEVYNKTEMDTTTNQIFDMLYLVEAAIDKLESVQNVVDVVSTKSALNSYNTSKLEVDDKIQVIADETHDGASTIYNWSGSAWQYVGAYGTNSYTKPESDNKFAPKATAITHTGNQLQDYSGNNIYPNISDNALQYVENNIDFSKTPSNYKLTKPISFSWEMGLYDHNNKYNSTTRCRSTTNLPVAIGKNVVHLIDNSVRYYVYEYLNGSWVGIFGNGWQYGDLEFEAKKGYTYTITASKNPESTLTNINDVSSKIFIYTQINYDLVIKNPKNAILRGICHRGFRDLAPENSIHAFKIASQMGFAYIETDVQFTSDNVPVMFHDYYINDKSNYTGENKRISDFTYNELLNYDFGSWFSSEYAGLKILSFDDFLTTMKKLNLISFIEIKTPSSMTSEQCQILYDKVLSKGMKYDVYWLGYDILSLARLREIDNDMNFAPAVPIGSITADGLNGFDQTFPNPHDLVIFTNINNINATTNQAFVDANKKCGVWGVDSDSTIANVVKASNYCCCYFQSDGINVLEALLNNL